MDERMKFMGRLLSEQSKISRHRVIEVAELLGNSGEQLQYEKNVPHASISAELVCGFTNDAYGTGSMRSIKTRPAATGVAVKPL